MALVFCNSLLLSELHHYTEHDHGDEFKCEISGSETHIHGDELEVSNCWACTFQFSPKQKAEIFEASSVASIFTFQNGFFYENASFEKADFHFFLRGPPELIS